jgi:hypothetical protein
MIAALYVQPDGCYVGLEGVDPWPEARDARSYDGPHAVIAHPPCERWGRYWFGGPSARVRRELGDDGGCFAAALASVRKWGGVLEHPEGSHAWRRFGISAPHAGQRSKPGAMTAKQEVQVRIEGPILVRRTGASSVHGIAVVIGPCSKWLPA